MLLSGGSLASNADLRQDAAGEWEIQGDPTEAAFLVAERKLGLHERRERRFERVGEIPFTSERKMMSTLAIDHEHGDAPLLITKGAPDVLLERCTRVRGRRWTSCRSTSALRAARRWPTSTRLADEALRTLAVAYRPLGPDEDAAGRRGARARPGLRRHRRHHRPAARGGGGRDRARRTAPASA